MDTQAGNLEQTREDGCFFLGSEGFKCCNRDASRLFRLFEGSESKQATPGLADEPLAIKSARVRLLLLED